MKIKFDTSTLTAGEARGLIAMLGGIMPDAIPTSYERVGAVERATGPVTLNIHHPAPDGYPTKPLDANPIDPHEDAVGVDPEPVATTGDRDKDGILWDERIHSGSKATNKDGTWTRRRNIEDALYNSVMTELRAKNAARTMEAAAALVPTPPPAVEPDAGAVFAAQAAPVTTVPTPPAAAAVPTPPPTAATGTAPDFAALMHRVTGGQREGKLDPAGLKEMLDQLGFDSIAKLISATPDQRLLFDALLTAKLG